MPRAELRMRGLWLIAAFNSVEIKRFSLPDEPPDLNARIETGTQFIRQLRGKQDGSRLAVVRKDQILVGLTFDHEGMPLMKPKKDATTLL